MNVSSIIAAINNNPEDLLGILRKHVSEKTDLSLLLSGLIKIIPPKKTPAALFHEITDFLDDLEKPYKNIEAILMEVPIIYIEYLVENRIYFSSIGNIGEFLKNLESLSEGIKFNIFFNTVFSHNKIKYTWSGGWEKLKLNISEELEILFTLDKQNFDYIVGPEEYRFEVFETNLKKIISILDKYSTDKIVHKSLLANKYLIFIVIKKDVIEVETEYIKYKKNIPFPYLNELEITLKDLVSLK